MVVLPALLRIDEAENSSFVQQIVGAFVGRRSTCAGIHTRTGAGLQHYSLRWIGSHASFDEWFAARF